MVEPQNPYRRRPMNDSNEMRDAAILDLYKLAVEMADRVSARRGTANAFFLSVQTTLISIIGLTYERLEKAHYSVYLALSIAGVTLSASWWLQLRSYRDLNTAKFAVINKLEENLPVQLFKDEWSFLKRDPLPPLRKRYAELGYVERVIPGVFAALYVLLYVGRVAL
ncbi:RipA family octameric membrane protein [Streptomyces werraensis]